MPLLNKEYILYYISLLIFKYTYVKLMTKRLTFFTTIKNFIFFTNINNKYNQTKK